jgi:hypothetical protein
LSLSGVIIIASYVGLVAIFGWWGLAAVAAHVGVLLLTVPRG